MFIVKRLKASEFFLVALTLGLTIFGIIMVFSASYYMSINMWGDSAHFLRRHVVWAILGLILMFATSIINYRLYAKFAPLIMLVGVVLLGLIFSPLGVEVNNATRWIGVGANNEFTLMPGETIKIALIIFVSWYLSKDPTRAKSLVRGFAPMVGLALVCAAMLVLQPSLSTAIIVVGIVIGIMFVAGLNPLVILGVVGAGGFGIYSFIMADTSMYWYRRLTSFMDPFADPLNTGHQAVQSLLALGSGGVRGLGLGQGIQKSLYLPEPHNDFILAIIGEELGFLGCILLFTAYIFMIWRGITIAINAPDLFGTLVAFGITIMLAIQVILNIAVVTSSMPPTGVTLPFLSFGGNALLLFMGSMGILLNISKQSARR
jgi:cell division protein FtsW